MKHPKSSFEHLVVVKRSNLISPIATHPLSKDWHMKNTNM